MKNLLLYSIFSLSLYTLAICPSCLAEQNKPAEPNESVESEDDIWSINVEDGKSATMTAPKAVSLRPKPSRTTSFVHWRQPEENVTHYIIRWGATPQNLTNELKLELSELDIVEDRIQGKMYRFDLLSAATDSKTPGEGSEYFYTLQAINNTSSSTSTPLARARLSREPMKNTVAKGSKRFQNKNNSKK